MRALAESGHDVVVVSTEAMSADRRQLGWEVPHLKSAEIILAPSAAQVREIVESSAEDSIHIISGARGTLLGKQAAKACRALGRRFGIVTEAPDPRGLAGVLRWVKYTWEQITIGEDFDFLLAMGEMGMDWFKSCGYSADRIYPFAYITELPLLEIPPQHNGPLHFLFAGRLIDLKGVDLLIRALAKIPDAVLTIVGDGPERPRLQGLAESMGVSERIQWLGQLKASLGIEHISRADVLVLPSRKDGWGAVVNEALMAGTPVICSTACGASDLIRHPWLGTVFRANDTDSLAKAMAQWNQHGPISPENRQRIRTWAHCIEANPIAKYMEKVLAHVYEQGPRPQAPWRQV
ncbi:MAG: glycosyltransferase family 4 protein [Verrucomicrobia bacterium]|nr:glycosyltransferase family 4 protein [Verrucomicrobiota bacterium]